MYCLPGALQVALIRGFAKRLQESKCRRRHAREQKMGVVVDNGIGALEPGGAGLILGMRFAGCRGFAA
jgi:hypothetical protein